MSTTQNLFQQAQLAEAAYANFIDPVTGSLYTEQEKIKSALIAAGFSKDPANPDKSTQADEFLKHWLVISHQPDTASGFSATLFQRMMPTRQAVFNF